MKRSDIIRSIQVSFKNMRLKDATVILDSILETLTDEVKAGNRVELRNFGVFLPRQYAAKSTTNPYSGLPMNLAASRQVLFRPSPELKKQMNKD